MNFVKDDSRKLHRLAVLNCVKQGRLPAKSAKVT